MVFPQAFLFIICFNRCGLNKNLTDQQFELSVEYKGDQLLLKASLIVTGYTHKFMVELDRQTIVFEPDEERNYRAVIPFISSLQVKGIFAASVYLVWYQCPFENILLKL